MTDGIRIEVVGAEPLLQAFAALEGRFEDLSPAWPGVASEVYAATRGRFDTEGAGSWERLTEAYATRKAKRYGAQKILRASGALEESLTGKDAAGAIYDPRRDSLTVGSSLPYARAHQFGNPKTNLPARPIFDVTEDLAQRIAARIEIDLTEYARGLGFAA